ncbi:MAG: TraB/GumN family protein [Gammaproteobacteria bacterium]|nr:TraB/GumN family protein [Gammaproteobacteria bacterium]
MMSSLVRVLLCLLLCSAPALADTDGHPVTLWRVAGNANTVYLLGSIHLLRPQDHPLPAVIERVYRDAEVLIMELDMDDVDSISTQQLFKSSGVLQDDRTLRDLMGEDAYEQAARAAEAIDIPIELLAKSEPWLAAVTVEMMALYRIGFNPLYGIESYMTTKAANDSKPIDGLESVEEQLEFLDGLSLQAQRDMLLQTLEDSVEISESIDEMVRAWRHGDIAALENGLLDSMAEHQELHEALVTQRNRRWVTQIRSLLDDSDDYLIIVGALHLVGEEGVPELLAAEGLEVSQLNEAPAVR